MTTLDPVRGDDAAGGLTAETRRSRPRARSTLRAVAMPTEHGGWGLTAEPIVLGLVIAPSVAGVLIGLAGVVAFLVRTPLKVALVDASRRRHLERTTVARRVAVGELAVMAALVAGAVLLAQKPFWVPAALAAPLVGVGLWFDMRSRSRRLAPELAGSVGISALVSMIVLADGHGAALAVGLWLVLSARVLTSIPFIRRQVAGLHGRSVPAWPLLIWDALAVVAAAVAVVAQRSLLAGAVAIVAVVAFQRLSVLRPTPRAVVLGIRQTIIGFSVVVITAAGVLVAG